MQLKGVIFDVDGTLVDNMMVHHRIWHRKINELGLKMSLQETIEKAHGVNIEFLRRFFGDTYSIEKLHEVAAEKEHEYREEMRRSFPLVAGSIALVQALYQEEFALAIGSAGPPENVHFVLEQSGLAPYFEAVYHSKNVKQGKPNPEVYLNGARDLGIAIDQCLVIEDTPIGAETALNAGCPVLIITTTHHPAEFAGLPNVVDYVTDFQEVTPARLAHYYNTWLHAN